MLTQRRRLLDLARSFAEELRSRSGVAGIVSYGSLAYGHDDDLTPFSDIDLLVILEGEMPKHFSEHRLRDGTKVDLSLMSLEEAESLARYRVFSLSERGWFSNLLMRTFLGGSPDAIFYDPVGEIERCRQRFLSATNEEELTRAEASRTFHQALTYHAKPAREDVRSGRLSDALANIEGAMSCFDDVLRELTGRKDRIAAAEALGMPEYANRASEIEALLKPSNLERRIETMRALWEGTIRIVCEPIRAALRVKGVENPDALEFAGEYDGLFWGGNRLQEWGRVLRDSELSLKWAEYRLKKGEILGAGWMLFAMSDSESVLKRWRAIDSALKDLGRDVSDLILPVLEGEEIANLARAADEAAKESSRKERTREEIEESLRSLEKMRDELARAAGFMTERTTRDSLAAIEI